MKCPACDNETIVEIDTHRREIRCGHDQCRRVIDVWTWLAVVVSPVKEHCTHCGYPVPRVVDGVPKP